MIRTAILGFWHVHAKRYTTDVINHPEMALVAAWDEDANRGRLRAAELKIPFVEKLDELLARSDVDAVIVECPTSLHHDVIIKAARAGKHVFSEKILAPTIKQASEIVAAADAAKVVLTTGMNFLYHDYIAALKAEIASGALGRLVNARVMNCHGGAIRNSLPAGVYNAKEACGGALIDMCHMVYLLPHLFGSLPASVYAKFAYLTKHEVEDSAVVLFDFADGSHATLEVGMVTKGAPPIEIEVNGTEGSMLFRADSPPSRDGAPKDSVFLKRAGDATAFAPAPLAPPSLPALETWVQHILAGTRHDENVARALDLARLNEAAYRSAAEGRAIALSSVTA